MYTPAHFAATDEDTAAFLQSVRTGDLVTAGPAGLAATFLPLLYDADGGGRLLGHVARNNEQWRDAGTEAMVITRASDGYVSPGWYASKQEHGRVVPTWNYVLGHVYGDFVAHDDSEWLRDVVTRLTDREEAGRERPWQVTDAPENYIEGQLRAIVGVEVRITRVELTLKLSQNRPAADIEGVIAGHAADGLVQLSLDVASHKP